MITLFTKYGEWLFRGASLAGIVAILWLNSQYVRTSQYQTDQAKIWSDLSQYQGEVARRLTAVEVAMLVMVESNKVNERQEVSLKEQELRLRGMEANIAKIAVILDQTRLGK